MHKHKTTQQVSCSLFLPEPMTSISTVSTQTLLPQVENYLWTFVHTLEPESELAMNPKKIKSKNERAESREKQVSKGKCLLALLIHSGRAY